MHRRPKMKMRNGLIITVTAVVILGLSSTPTWAGSKQQHRWEGVAIGVGAAIVGSALINHHAYGYYDGPPVAFSFNYREDHRSSARHHGNWNRRHGGHPGQWGPIGRGQRYRGHHRNWNTHVHRHPKSWKSDGRRTYHGQGRHSRGHDGRRR